MPHLQTAIVQFARRRGRIRTRDVVERFGVTRQYAHRILRTLVVDGTLVRQGTTRNAVYVRPGLRSNVPIVVRRRIRRDGLEEDAVLMSLDRKTPALLGAVPANVRSLLSYAFLEMLNNAIDHSTSRWIEVTVQHGDVLRFRIRDFGVGVFRNVMRKRKLSSEREAVQDLLKGKTTTAPERHSGEGIFFTSKMADVFQLESFGMRLTVDNVIGDVFLESVSPKLRGTEVIFQIAESSSRVMGEIFRQFQHGTEAFAFDRTTVRVQLFSTPDAYLSRSQARRLLVGLERFRVIVLDFAGVRTVGQGFVDEIFRVFQNAHPQIHIQSEHMQEDVAYMVRRAQRQPLPR